MPNPRAAENLPPVQIEPAIAAQAIVVTREQTLQLGPQLRRKALISIEPEHPLDVWLQLFQSPAPLGGVTDERVCQDARPVSRRD